MNFEFAYSSSDHVRLAQDALFAGEKLSALIHATKAADQTPDSYEAILMLAMLSTKPAAERLRLCNRASDLIAIELKRLQSEIDHGLGTSEDDLSEWFKLQLNSAQATDEVAQQVKEATEAELQNKGEQDATTD